MKKIFSFFLVIVLMGTIMMACDRSNYEQEAYDQIKAYTEEIVPVVKEVIREVRSWLNSNSNLSFKEIDDLINQIEDINTSNWDTTWPEYEEVSQWEIKKREGIWVTHTIKGEDLAKAIWDLKAASEQIVNVFSQMQTAIPLEYDLNQVLTNLSQVEANQIKTELEKLNNLVNSIESIFDN